METDCYLEEFIRKKRKNSLKSFGRTMAILCCSQMEMMNVFYMTMTSKERTVRCASTDLFILFWKDNFKAITEWG